MMFLFDFVSLVSIVSLALHASGGLCRHGDLKFPRLTFYSLVHKQVWYNLHGQAILLLLFSRNPFL